MSKQLESSIVRIKTSEGIVVGAGFLITQKLILTCAHVVAQALDIPEDTIEAPTNEICLDFPLIDVGKTLTAQVVGWKPVQPSGSLPSDDGEDIAVLELESFAPNGAKPVRLVKAEDLWQHPFRSFGFPEGYDDGVWASGVLQGQQARGWIIIKDLDQTGYFVEPGFSGGPVWDETLKGVAGMAVAADTRSEIRAGFIIPTPQLIRAWPQLAEQAIIPCPYRGLLAFREEDAKFFFGRQTYTNKLVALVQQPSLVAVVGASGSGKSSVVFAGLIPHLRAQGNWQIVDFRPGDRPLDALAAALIPLLEPQLDKSKKREKKRKLVAEFRKESYGLRDVVEEIIYSNPGVRLLLVIDQFEELYSSCKDEQERLCFLERLLETVPYTLNFNVVLTLRADFFGHVLSYRPLADALEYADLKLGPMNRQELREAIEKPAEQCSVELEPGLTELILDAVSEEPGNLPLLEFALTLLWEAKSEHQLTHSAYGAIGGVEKALASYAQQNYEQLNRLEQLVAKKLFLELTQLGEGPKDTRRQVQKKDLVDLLQKEVLIHFGLQAKKQQSEMLPKRQALVERVIQKMATAKLVVTRALDKDGERVAVVDVAHEALIRHWSLLGDWLEKEREALKVKRTIETEAQKWAAQDKPQRSAYLLRGKRLTEAENFIQNYGKSIALLEVAQELIKASRRSHKVAQVRNGLAIFIPLAIFTVSAIVIGQKSLEQQIQNLREAALLGNVSRDLLPALPELLKVADQNQEKTEVDQAMAGYRNVLMATIRFQQEIEEKSKEFQPQDLPKVEEIKDQAKTSLLIMIKEHRLPQLEQELKNGQWGDLKEDLSYTEGVNQYEEGALKTTYKILWQDFGIEAGLTSNKLLDTPEEAEQIPCELLEAIEKLWRRYTDNRCGWYGSSSYYREPACRQIDGETLTTQVFAYPYTDVKNRLQSCQIGSESSNH